MKFRKIEHGEVDSTSERAFADLARGSARDGDVHIAHAQTHGRGRLGRTWHSAAGKGLFVSIVHLPPPPPLLPQALTVAAGLALIDALASVRFERAELEWPNDVVVAGRKLAGILVETRGLDAGAPHYVIGIGLNVSQTSFPDALEREREVTSLALEGCKIESSTLLDALLEALPARLLAAAKHLTQLAEDYLVATNLRGKQVLVRMAKETLTGTIETLDLERGLVLRTETGTQRVVLEHVRELTCV